MKKYFENLAFMVCLSYTVVSFSGAIINMISGSQTSNVNEIVIFVLCVIASVVLSLHGLFENLSMLAVMVIQYIAACALGTVFLLIVNIFNPISPRGWFELFRSFTIPYVVLALFYYYSVFTDTRKKDNLIKDIQKNRKEA